MLREDKLNEEATQQLADEITKHQEVSKIVSVSEIDSCEFWETDTELSWNLVRLAHGPITPLAATSWAERFKLLFEQRDGPNGSRSSEGSRAFRHFVDCHKQREWEGVPSITEFLQERIPSLSEKASSYGVGMKTNFSLEAVDLLWPESVTRLDGHCDELHKLQQDGENLIRRELNIFVQCGIYEQYSEDAVRLLSAYVEIRNFGYTQKGENLLKVAAIFGDRLKNKESNLATSLQELQGAERLDDLANALENVRKHTDKFETQTWNLLDIACRSSELIKFIGEVVANDPDFDPARLIDGAEDHAYEIDAVNDKTVKDFIKLYSFLKRMLTEAKFENVEHLLADLVTRFRKQTAQDLLYGGVGIDELFDSCARCADGLKRMYNSLANRQEATRQVAKKIVASGEYVILGPLAQTRQVSCQQDVDTMALNGDLPCDINERSRMLAVVNTKCAFMSDTDCAKVIVKSDRTSIYSLTRLRDLRSRALLQVSSLQLRDDHTDASAQSKNVLAALDANVELLEDIVAKLMQLCALG
eukprot:SAG11_NODE_3076_length_2710_cov_1.222903_2_plen_530_part_01